MPARSAFYDENVRILIAILVVACVAVPASAQDTATLFGTVADITGGVLGEVRLEVAGPVRRTVVTGPEGTFEVASLPFGTYRVTVEREGFSTYEETVLLDSPRRELPVELPLSPFTQFVETVSRVVEERAQAPFLVTVVEGEEIDETGAATLDEALRTVAGLQHGTQGNAYTRVATRGLRDTRDVLVLIDGAPLRQLSGSADLTMVPVPMLEGVEFVKGATSSVYGRGAVGGVMQFFTVPEATEVPVGEITYRAGSFATHEARTAISLPYGGGRFAATGSASRSDGHQEDTGRDTAFLSLVNDYSAAGRLNTRLQYLASDVEAGRGSIVPLENGRPMFGITREQNFGIPDAVFDARLQSLSARTDVIASSNVVVTNSFNFNRYTRLATGGITIVPPPTTRTKGWWQSDSAQDTFLNDTTVQWTTGTLNLRNTFLAGLGLEWGDEARVSPRFRSGQTFIGPDYVNPVGNIQNGPKGIPAGEVTSDFEQRIVSGYLQNRVEVGRVVGTVGLRWDDFDQELRRSDTGVVSSFDGSKLSPRAGVTVNLTGNAPLNVAAFAHVSRGFRPQFPSLSTRSGVVIPVLLKPEVTRNVEGGLRLLGSAVSMQAAVFNMRKLDGPRSFRTGPETFLFTNATTSVRGFESEVQSVFAGGHQLYANYAFHDARHDEFRTTTGNFDGFQLRMSPRHIAGAGVTLRFGRSGLADNVVWTAGVSFVGDRPLRDNVMNPQILPSYTLFNTAVSFRLADVQLVLAATNLSDQYYIADDFSSQNAGNPGIPRRFTAQLRYSFGGR